MLFFTEAEPVLAPERRLSTRQQSLALVQLTSSIMEFCDGRRNRDARRPHSRPTLRPSRNGLAMPAMIFYRTCPSPSHSPARGALQAPVAHPRHRRPIIPGRATICHRTMENYSMLTDVTRLCRADPSSPSLTLMPSCPRSALISQFPGLPRPRCFIQ